MTSYRLQGNKEQPAPPDLDGNPQKTHFGADHEIAILDYLQTLGVENIYDWPQTEAQPGHAHGYSVVNYDRIDPKLGGEDGLRRKSAELKKRDMGLILDWVPNHMFVSHLNRMLYDVWKNGQDSKYAKVFEIDWNKTKGANGQPVFPVPTLGAQFGDVLERIGQPGFIVKEEPNGDITVNYYDDNKFPFKKETADKIRERVKDGNITDYFNAPEHWDELADLMDDQHWRLTFWRYAFGEIAHRRFFDVNGLIGVRQEDPDVFALTHEPLAQWIRDGLIQGVRVDHIDGVAYPLQYVKDLRDLIDKNTPPGAPRIPIYLEKIHELTARGQQRLPKSDNPAIPDNFEGTSGYEFTTSANNLLVNRGALPELDSFYREFSGENRAYEDILQASKEKILEETFTSEMKTLGKLLEKVAQGNRHTRDFTEHDMNRAVRSILTHFDVYRTYNTPGEASEEDIACLDHAITEAKIYAEDKLADQGAIDFVGRLLKGQVSNNAYQGVIVEMTDAFRKTQQLSGPLMAKAKEDTTFYIYNRCIALNEVGGDPGRFGMTPEEFDAEMLYWQKNFPETMTALQTHDTKRGPDARLRILAAMTEFTQDWKDSVTYWATLNQPRRKEQPISRNDEYMLYQTLIATWPEDMKLDDPRLTVTQDGHNAPEYVEKIAGYMQKAIREAKVKTSWTQNTAYETDVRNFVTRILDPKRSGRFLNDLAHFAQKVAPVATMHSLGQIVLQSIVPGEMDVYQGSEFIDLSLVDPDNRKPVDYDARIKSMEELKTRPAIDKVLKNGDQAKQAVMQRVLNFRKDNKELFRKGTYSGVYAEAAADHGRFKGVLQEFNGSGVLGILPLNIAGDVDASKMRDLDLRGVFRDVSIQVPSLAGKTLTDTFTHRTLVVPEDGRIDVGQLLETSPVGHWSFGDAILDNNPVGPMKMPAGFIPVQS